MKQKTIERKILAHMLDNINDLEIVIDNGITEEFFWYTLPHSNKPLYAGLFNMVIETKVRNGSLLTKDILQDKLEQRLTKNKGVSDIDGQKAKLLTFFDEIKMENIIDGELMYFIQKIKENWNGKIMAHLSSQVQRLQKEAKNENNDETWTYVGKNLVKYLDQNLVSTTRGGRIKTRDLMRDTDLMVSELKERIENPENYEGIFIGLPPIDEVTNGFRAGQLIIFIGQVASGKTTLLTNLAYNACSKYNKNILFFSLEMLEWMMISKFNARDVSVDYGRFRDGALSEEEQNMIFRRLKERKEEKAGFWHKEMTGECTVSDIEREIRKMFMQDNIDAVFVDYLGIIDPSPQFGNQRWEQLGRAAERLRVVAKEYEVPVITAVQANRDAIKKVKDNIKSSAPEDINFGAESVAESITIANTADVIFGIYTDFDEGKMWIHQVKNREGNVPTFRLTVQPSRSYIGYDEASSALEFLNSDNIISDYDTDGLSSEGFNITEELEKLDDSDNGIDDDLDNLDTINGIKVDEDGVIQDNEGEDEDWNDDFGDLDSLDELI
jgi:replicative DNA helicase